MRARYLFLLAEMCSVPPKEVDDLSLPDFFNLTDGIDVRIDQAKEASR